MSASARHAMARARSLSHASPEGSPCAHAPLDSPRPHPHPGSVSDSEGVKGNTGPFSGTLLGNSFFSYVLAGLAGDDCAEDRGDSEPVSWVWKGAQGAGGGEGEDWEEVRYVEYEKQGSVEDASMFSWFTSSSPAAAPSPPAPLSPASSAPGSATAAAFASTAASPSSAAASLARATSPLRSSSSLPPTPSAQRLYGAGSPHHTASPKPARSRLSSSSSASASASAFSPSSSSSTSSPSSSSPKYDGSAKACEETSLLASVMSQLSKLDPRLLSAAGTPLKRMAYEEDAGTGFDEDERLSPSALCSVGSKQKWD